MFVLGGLRRGSPASGSIPTGDGWLCILWTGVLASLYGVVNAAWTRVRRVAVKLPNLPESWRGRVAALVSDTHLGHVRGARFLRRIVTTLTRLRPDIVFIAGDMYDGTFARCRNLPPPWPGWRLRWGAFLSPGITRNLPTPRSTSTRSKGSGVRVLNNEKVTVDGLQIVGVHYRDSTNDDHFRSVLRRRRWTATAPASCSPTRPTGSKSQKRKVSRCSSPATPTAGSFSRSPGLLPASTASSSTDCNVWAIFSSTHRTEQAPGVRRCGWAPRPRSY